MNNGSVADSQVLYDAIIEAQRASEGRISSFLSGLWGASPQAMLSTVAADVAASNATLSGGQTEAQRLRILHAAALGLDAEQLELRALYPNLDRGVYCCSHSMGVPSVVGPAAVLHQLAEVAEAGIGVWDEGTWVEVMTQYRARVAALVGGDLENGDVVWFPNASDALSAVLEGVNGGTLVYTAGHFTTGHYVHHQWAQNCGGRLLEVPVDEDGSVPTARILDALTPDVRVLSISHALFESGWLQDVPALAAGLRERCPGAILLLDAYQTAGSVPIDAAKLGDHVLVVGGGHKQLRSGTGAGFLYIPRRWLKAGPEQLTPRRTGWWGHAAAFAFEKGAVRRAEDGSRMQAGTPTLTGMAMLLGELTAAASVTGGDLPAAVQRARRVTAGLVDVALRACAAHGLKVRGGWGSERRAAFVCVEITEGNAAVEALAARGLHVDFRPRFGGARDGWLRVSGNSAGFPYEIEAVIAGIARVAKGHDGAHGAAPHSAGSNHR